jgi:hypothetical protein
MADEKEATGTNQKVPRHRSPNYPGISLKAAVEKITAWYKADGHVASLKAAAMTHMNGDLGRVVSALKTFGLVNESDGRIKLDQRGLDIVARQADDQKRKQALRSAVMGPAVYREIIKEYPNGLPSDATLQAELVTSKSFNHKHVEAFIKDLKTSLAFAEITPATVLDSEVDEETEDVPALKVGDSVQWESQGIAQFQNPRAITGFSDDSEWAFVEGSSTGVPVSELEVVTPTAHEPPPMTLPERIKPKSPPPNPAFSQPQNRTPVGADIPVAKDCLMGVNAQGRVTQEGIAKLISYLGLIKTSFPTENE